jgi:hypothetical protein
MAERRWEVLKVVFCERAGCEVALEAQMAYPSEVLPDQPPRLISKRCSRGLECNFWEHMTCVWAGTNPLYDPFAETH